MPKININGITREMTAAEEAEYARLTAEAPEPVPDPTEERMLQLEAALIELAAIMTGGDA